MRRTLPACAALLLAACLPARVEITEQPAGGFTAIAFGEDEAGCRDARERVTEEARYHCRARGRRPSLGRVVGEDGPGGCRVELPFWCTGP